MKIDITREKALRYIGYRGQDISSINSIVDNSIEEIKKTSEPNFIIEKQKIVEFNDEGILLDNNILLTGKAIKKHLYGCKIVIIIVATIGFGVDKKIMTYQNIDATKSIILDSTGSAMIEEVMDNINTEIKNEYSNLTKRFSPGYGDLPLETNKTIIEKYNLYRKMGITINSSFLMSPSKTVTAIVGIKEQI